MLVLHKVYGSGWDCGSCIAARVGDGYGLLCLQCSRNRGQVVTNVLVLQLV